MRPVEDSEAGGSSVSEIVRLALREDIGEADITSDATLEPGRQAVAHIECRQEGVLSGLEIAREVARAVDAEVVFEALRADGDRIAPLETIARLRGRARSLLTMERTLLNFLQRLSGVASVTARYVAAVEGTGVRIVDTRKTTPGLRALEKRAVVHGGGGNHRMGLFDAFMVKDNHIAAAGSIQAAVGRIRASGLDRPLVVEADTVEQAEEAARLGADQVLLDNMDPETIRLAVDRIRAIEREAGDRPIRIEVSGGVTLETIRARALPGVDMISVGALTHSAPALDLALEIELRPDA